MFAAVSEEKQGALRCAPVSGSFVYNYLILGICNLFFVLLVGVDLFASSDLVLLLLFQYGKTVVPSVSMYQKNC